MKCGSNRISGFRFVRVEQLRDSRPLRRHATRFRFAVCVKSRLSPFHSFILIIPTFRHVSSSVSTSLVLPVVSTPTMTPSSFRHVFFQLCFIALLQTEAHVSTPQYRHPHPSASHDHHKPSPHPPFVIVDLPPSPTPSAIVKASPPPPIPSNSSMDNNTITAAVDPVSIQGVNTSATTLNYLVPTLAIITCAISLTISYGYANTSNPYRPYVTGASISDYSLPNNRRPLPHLRRYHATSLDPNAVPLPEAPPPPGTTGDTSQPAIPRDSPPVDPVAPTSPNSRARLQLDENELSFARRNEHISSTTLR